MSYYHRFVRHLDGNPHQHVTAVERVPEAAKSAGQTAVGYRATCSCGWVSAPYCIGSGTSALATEIARDWALSAAKVHRLTRAASGV